MGLLLIAGERPGGITLTGIASRIFTPSSNGTYEFAMNGEAPPARGIRRLTYC
jgi:hypothetical protein